MDPIVVRAVTAFVRDVDGQRSPLTAEGMRHGAELAWEFADRGGYGAGAFGDAVHRAKEQGVGRDEWIAACLDAFHAVLAGRAR